ncbi:MAG: hypothetical protein QME66_03045 [Candidatus Eisenbacteria bacterium]|nr:hypothetical protein [Candidatus Eisenbacteria bacterium]
MKKKCAAILAFIILPSLSFSQTSYRHLPPTISGLSMSSSFLVSGDCVDVQGDSLAGKIYVANGWGVLIFSVPLSGDPVFLGGFPTRGTASSVCIFGNLAYVADGDSLLKIEDVSDPQNPLELTAYAAAGRIFSVAVLDSVLFLSLGEKGFEIAKIMPSGPPIFRGIYNPRANDGVSFVSSVRPAPGKVFLACGTGGLWVMNVSNPADPAFLGKYVPSTPSYFTWCVDIVDGYAFLANGYAGVEVVNVSNPQLILSQDTLGSLGNVVNLRLMGRKAFAACGQGGGLKVISGENPSSLSKLGEASTAGRAYSVALFPQKVILADGEDGLYVFDVSDPSLPAQTGRYAVTGKVHSADWSGDMLCAAYGQGGLKLCGVGSPAQPQVIGSLSLPGTTFHTRILGGFGLSASGIATNFALAACGDSGVYSVDITTPSSPTPSARILAGRPAQQIALLRKLAFIALGDSGVAVVSVEDPSSPSVLKRVNIPGSVYSMSISGHFAYLACGDSTLTVLDIADSLNPTIVGRFRKDWETTQGVAVVDSFAYLANGAGGVLIINVANPASPSLAGTLLDVQEALDVLVKDSFLYVAGGTDGVCEYSLSLPRSPSLTARFDTPGWAAYLSSGPGRNVFVGDHDDATLLLSDTSPVNLVHFVAERDEKGTLLKWRVNSLDNLVCFNLYRKGAGDIAFRQVARVGKNSKEYEYLDEIEGEGGLLEYRLALVDAAGNESMSAALVIDLKGNLGYSRGLSLRLWPSVSGGEIHLEIRAPARLNGAPLQGKKFTVRLFDSMGRSLGKLEEGTLVAGVAIYKLDTRFVEGRRLPSGVYFAELETDFGHKTEKFVLVR